MAKAKEPENKHCGICQYSVFNTVWGEYKCTKKCRYVYKPDEEAKTCGDYKAKEKKE